LLAGKADHFAKRSRADGQPRGDRPAIDFDAVEIGDLFSEGFLESEIRNRGADLRKLRKFAFRLTAQP